MRDLEREARIYFAPRAEDFWHWADQYRVIEGSKGQTICYREELVSILKELQIIGLMPLEVILLILAAGKESWPITDFMYHTVLPNEHLYNSQPIGSAEAIGRYELINDVIYSVEVKAKPILAALNRISQLPKALRSGAHMVHLIKSITTLSIPLYSLDKANFFIQELASGRIPEANFVAPVRGDDQLETIRHYLSPLDEIQNLEHYLRTGLDQELQPLPLPEPELQSDDLMTQLANDPQTTGLARLAKRLIAALNIPPHTQGASDQPLGGVSDISNRGDYDRLLLSELANDDDTLSARLVNNEALYLRRETPPDPQVQERVILVDTSLRLWGTPRVFAVAAALGCALNNPHKAKVTAFALGQEASAPNALSSKEEVLHFLEKISPVLHPGEALRSFFQQNAVSRQQSLFLITSEEVMADQEFARMLAEFRHRLDYLLVLSRSGELHTYKVGNGRKSLINTSTFDLPRFLFDHKKPDGIARLIEVLELKNESFQPKNALLLPTFPGRVRRHEVAYNQHLLVAVLPSRKVWLWHSAEKGAIEILPAIEQGDYRFYLEKDELQCLIVYAPNNLIKAYLFKQNQLQREVDFTKKITRYAPHWMVIPLPEFPGTIHTCGFKEGNLLVGIIGSNGYRGYPQAATHVLDLAINALLVLPGVQSLSRNTTRLSLSTIKPIINNGYSVLRNIRSIGVTKEGNLQLDQFQIVLNTELWLEKKSNDLILYKDLIYEPMLNPHFYTRSAKWANGCKVVVDSHGFIHFYLPGSATTAFTLTLIIGKPLAAYVKNDTFMGNPYFYNASPERVISARDFYRDYMRVFIDKIQESS